MLLPKFSTRWILAATAAFAGVSLIASFAFQDYIWAIAIFAGLMSLALSFVVFAVLFLAGWYAMLLVSLIGRGSAPSPIGASPFRNS